jgi:hypothetical protein
MANRPTDNLPQEVLHPSVPVDEPEGLETPKTQGSDVYYEDSNDDNEDSNEDNEGSVVSDSSNHEDKDDEGESGGGKKRERRGSTGPMDDPDAPPAVMEYLRRGRRSQIYAPPVELEEGWQPRVVEKDKASKKRYDQDGVLSVSSFIVWKVYFSRNYRILDVISDNILFRDHDEQDRDIIVDAMELKTFETVGAL